MTTPVSVLIGEMAGALVLAIGLCSGHPRQAFGGDKTEVELQGFLGELQLIKSGGGGGDRDSFPEEGAPRSSGFNHGLLLCSSSWATSCRNCDRNR